MAKRSDLDSHDRLRSVVHAINLQFGHSKTIQRFENKSQNNYLKPVKENNIHGWILTLEA